MHLIYTIMTDVSTHILTNEININIHLTSVYPKCKLTLTLFIQLGPKY